MTSIAIDINYEAIRQYCEERPVQRLALFGSVIRDDFTSQSDVDVLIQFLPDSEISYFDMVDIQDDLSNLFSYPVDLLTPFALSDYIRDDILNQAITIYER